MAVAPPTVREDAESDIRDRLRSAEPCRRDVPVAPPRSWSPPGKERRERTGKGQSPQP